METLEAYLARIVAIAARGEAHLLGDRDAAELARARAEMARVFIAYQLHVHREFFEPMLASGDALAVARARTLKVECIAVVEEQRAHMMRWARRDVDAEWDEYRVASLAIVQRIREHAARIRREVEAIARDRGVLPAHCSEVPLPARSRAA